MRDLVSTAIVQWRGTWRNLMSRRPDQASPLFFIPHWKRPPQTPHQQFNIVRRHEAILDGLEDCIPAPTRLPRANAAGGGSSQCRRPLGNVLRVLLLARCRIARSPALSFVATQPTIVSSRGRPRPRSSGLPRLSIVVQVAARCSAHRRRLDEFSAGPQKGPGRVESSFLIKPPVQRLQGLFTVTPEAAKPP